MTIPFIDATLATGGGKAANLGELQRAGFPVPDGFVVTADTYRNAVADLDLDTEGPTERIGVPALTAHHPPIASAPAIRGSPPSPGLPPHRAGCSAPW